MHKKSIDIVPLGQSVAREESETERIKDVRDKSLGSEGKLPSKFGFSGDMMRDGFSRIDEKKISKAVQNQHIDDGKVKTTYPSCTASGHLKKKHGKQ